MLQAGVAGWHCPTVACHPCPFQAPPDPSQSPCNPRPCEEIWGRGREGAPWASLPPWSFFSALKHPNILQPCLVFSFYS